jgi:hypothetical protein
MPIDYLADFPVARIWRGDSYDQTRILVLGESWYGSYEADHLFDDGWVSAWLGGEVRDDMYTKMARAVGLTSDELWQSIAFTNYVQCVGPVRKNRPTRAMYEAGAIRLRAILAELKPRVVWLLGKQQAKHSSRVTEEVKLPSVVSRHPSFASYAETREAWAKVLEAAAVDEQELKRKQPRTAKRLPGEKRPVTGDEESLRHFMESYRVAWERRDLEAFLPMYDRPMLTLRLNGSLHCLKAEADFREFFSAALDGYVATGFEKAELAVDRIAPAGRTAAVVDVTWKLRRAPNEVVKQFRQTYNVRTTPGGWKIYTSTQHIE